MASVRYSRGRVQPSLTATDMEWFDSTQEERPPVEPPGSYLESSTAADWFARWARYHHQRSRYRNDLSTLISTTLSDVVLALRELRGVQSVSRLVAEPGLYRGIDLVNVMIPGRENSLADQVDHEASWFLSQRPCGELHRLAAAVLVRLASDIETSRAETIEEYYELDEADLEPAFRAALETVVEEESDPCASLENPTW